MTRKEVADRFNELPLEHRITIIANELYTEISWLEREKKEAVSTHAKNLKRLNTRIKILAHELENM